MGLRARERVKKLFSWESVALKTLAFYGELVKPSKTAEITPPGFHS